MRFKEEEKEVITILSSLRAARGLTSIALALTMVWMLFQLDGERDNESFMLFVIFLTAVTLPVGLAGFFLIAFGDYYGFLPSQLGALRALVIWSIFVVLHYVQWRFVTSLAMRWEAAKASDTQSTDRP